MELSESLDGNQKTVITGIGIICPIGDSIEKVYENIEAKRNIIGSKVAVIENFNPKDYLKKDAKLVRFMSKETQFATIAASKAIEDTKTFPYSEYEIAIYAGTGTTGIEFTDIEKMLNTSVDENGLFDIKKFGSEALYALNPLISFQILPNMPVCVASIYSKIKGNNQVFNPWEGNAAHALLEAYYDLQMEKEKCVIVGGSDYKTNSGAFITLSQYGLMNNQENDLIGKPFNPDSKGFIPGEGSAYLVLENLSKENKDHAYAQIIAIETVSDRESSLNYSMNSDLLADLILKTLEVSELTIKDIELIFSSADGNYMSDKIEEEALKKVFCENLPLVLTPKEFTGNIFSASPYINIALGAYMLKNNLKNITNILITGFGIGSEKFCSIIGKIENE